MRNIIRDLKIALKKDDEHLRVEIKKIIKKYGKKKPIPKGDFNLKAGNVYYINEKNARLTYRIMEQLLERGMPALCITRVNPERFALASRYPSATFYWLTSLRKKNSLNPSDLSKIQATVTEFLKNNDRSVIVIDGVETMIMNTTSFIKVLTLLIKIRDMISETHSILLVPIDLDTLSPQEKAAFETEMMNEIPVKRK